MSNLNSYLIPLFGKIYTPKMANENFVDPHHVELFNAELAACGYNLSLSAMEKLRKSDRVSFYSFRSDVLDVVSNLSKIPNVNVLFKKFPYDIPGDFDYFVRRIMGHLRQFMPHGHEGKVLSCGHVIDLDLFDVSEFGACPICQHQVDELNGNPIARNQYQNVSPLKILDLMDAADVIKSAENLLSRQSSLSKQEKDFLQTMLGLLVKIKLPEKCFKETLPFIYESMGNIDYVKSQISGAADVLRLAYYISDHDSDLSLKDNVKFKLSNKHVRNFLSMLEDIPNLVEDLMRHRERWLRFGEIAHPTSAKNTKKYPVVAMAFDTLRNFPNTVETFNRKVHHATQDKNVLAMVDILSSRPGEFARRLDNMISIADGSTPPNEYRFNEIIKAFSMIVEEVPTKILLEISSHFRYRSGKQADSRLFFIKGSQNIIYYKPENRGPIDSEIANEVVSIASNELKKRFYKKHMGFNELGKVYIDQKLNGMLLPFNRRGDSNKSENILSKGSRLPFHGSVLRLFVWWKGHVDVDLSANFYNADWDYVDHVAYTHLSAKGGYAVHSGDIVDAPNGATEFIDIDIAKCKTVVKNARYVVASIISYRGDSFDGFPCFGGFMERGKLGGGGELFEPTSVATKFEVKQKSTKIMTFAFDLITNEVILMDMAMGGGRYQNAAHSTEKFRTVAKHIVSLPDRKPTFFDILNLHAQANGKLVDTKDDADTVFDMETIDEEMIYNLISG